MFTREPIANCIMIELDLSEENSIAALYIYMSNLVCRRDGDISAYVPFPRETVSRRQGFRSQDEGEDSVNGF